MEPFNMMRTIHRCSSAVVRLYMRCMILACASLVKADYIDQLVSSTLRLLFSHVLRQLVEESVQIIDGQGSFNDRRARIHDVIKDSREITSGLLQETQAG